MKDWTYEDGERGFQAVKEQRDAAQARVRKLEGLLGSDWAELANSLCMAEDEIDTLKELLQESLYFTSPDATLVDGNLAVWHKAVREALSDSD